MPADPRKRQKKLERRAAKRKEKKHSVIRSQSSGLPGQLSAASKFPVLNCWIVEEDGIGSLHLSRAFPNGQVAAANFLVDRWCLGIKDTWAEVLHRTAYDEKYLRDRGADLPPPRHLKPEDARKLLEDAVEYARGLGFAPHADYSKAVLLFGDIDPAQSTAEFEFGKDGKPFFVSGPNDTPERCKQIVATLLNNCGPGNFDYLIRGPGIDFIGGELDEYDEDEDSGW
jgi:hypothetical protein